MRFRRQAVSYKHGPSLRRSDERLGQLLPLDPIRAIDSVSDQPLRSKLDM